MSSAVVTGAASGIGRALATRLASEGHQVHLVDLATTVALAAQLGGVAHVADVGAADDMDRVAGAAGDSDVVCLNAGIVGPTLGAPWEVPQEEWQRVLQVNVLGLVNGLRTFVPRLLARSRPGRLVITGSLAGLVTFPGGGAYAASKHAVVALAEQAFLALEGTPVSVTLACPALVRTGMSDSGEDPDDVAGTILAAADAGRFLVLPAEWRAAVAVRGERLASGHAPGLPAPAGA